MQCPKCQHENPAQAKFCMECATKLELACSKCGTKLPPEAKFCMECATPVGDTPHAPAEASTPRLEDMVEKLYIPQPLQQRMDSAERELEGENRLVTVLFVDISGFTPISQQLPNEQVIERVNQCFRVVTDAVYRYEGSVNRFIGDCVLAFFGAPIAHENDTERAILAALEMQEKVSELGLRICIGINTGNMYFGSIGSPQHEEVSAYGPEVILAQRLQTTAEPGQVLVGEVTYRQTRRAFVFERLSPLMLKGIDKPTPAYQAVKVLPHPEKVRGIEGLYSPMIGRDEEFSKLSSCFSELCDGRGQIASIIGVAGVGKSRLVKELKAMSGEEVLWLEGRCLSIGESAGYWPFVDILKSYFGFDVNDTEPMMAEKIKNTVTDLLPNQADEVLPLFGNLLSVKFGDELDDRLKFAGPEQVKHQTFMALRDLFMGVAQKQPLMIVLEDLHWADSLSLDLTNLLMEMLTLAPMMLLCVYRPEQDHKSWRIGSVAQSKCLDRYTEIHLRELRQSESRRMVEQLLRIENLPERVKTLILEKSEGNPFFVEEVIRSLIDTEVVYHDGEGWRAKAEIETFIVPDTIQSVIMTRIDRLEDEVKYALQCASVIGRLFRRRLLAYTSEREQMLDQYLWKLEDNDLIYEERAIPELEYSFKHVLTQETAYSSLLERRQREFHRKVGEGIETLYRERLEEFYDELAYHYDKSANVQKAVEYLLKAGDKAKGSYANETAIAHFQRALEIMDQNGMERKDWKLAALRELGEVFFGIGKTVEAEKAFERAIALAKEMGLPPRQLVRLYHWISEALFWQSQFDEVIRYGEMGLEVLGEDTECLEAALMNARIAVGNSNKGNSEKWQEYTHKNMAFIKKLEYSVELRPPYVHIVLVLTNLDRDLEAAWDWAKQYQTLAAHHHDLRGVADVWICQGRILARKGDHENALSTYQKSLEMFERIGDDKHVSWGHQFIAGRLFYSGHIEEAETHAQIFLRLAEQVEIPRDIAGAHSRLGDIAMCQRRWEEAIFHYRKCLEGRQAIWNPKNLALAHLQLGKVYLKNGDPRRALQSFEKAADGAVETQQVDLLSDALWGLEGMRVGSGESHAFIEFCRTFKEQHGDAVANLSLRQWSLKTAQSADQFPHLTFADDFNTENIHPSWTWIDEFSDCAHRILESGGVEISAANGRDFDGLNVSAPRFMREVSGDFAAEVCVSPASDDKPWMGGLLIHHNKDNFLRFDVGVNGKHEMRLHGYVDGKQQIVGRGILHHATDIVHLRLERLGDEFFTYCSAGGENWFTCGTMASPLDDPIQLGICAIGMIDRTIYCGAYPDGTATVFRDFNLWTR